MVDKNLMWVSIIVALAVGFLIGFVAMRQRAIGTMEAFKLITQRQIEEARESVGKQGGEFKLRKVYVLENGQLNLEEGNKTLVAEVVTLGNGAIVSITGLVTKPDGSTVQLKDGESILEDGTVIGKEAIEDGAMVEDKMKQ